MKILVFGAAVDLIGSREIWLELPSDSDVNTLKTELLRKFPALKNLSSMAIAVNESYVLDDLRLDEKDVVALIPPVSGG